MKNIQDENIFILLLGLFVIVALILWVRIGDIKETERLNEKGLEMDSYIKSKSWRVYIIGGIGILCIIFEILKKLYHFFFF